MNENKAQQTPNGAAKNPENAALSCERLNRLIGGLRAAVPVLERPEAAGVPAGASYAREALARLEAQAAACAAPRSGNGKARGTLTSNPAPAEAKGSTSAVNPAHEAAAASQGP